MKTKKLLIAAFTILAFFGCSTNDNTTTDSKSVSNDDIALTAQIDATIEDIAAIAEDQFSAQQSIAAKSTVVRKSILPSCATFTTVLTNSVWTRTIDFGTQGCALPNGNLIKGKIIISFTNDFSNSTHTISYVFDGFYHNGRLIQGSKSMTYSRQTSDLLNEIHPIITHAIDMKITFADAKVYEIKGSRTKEMVEGYNTPLEWEDNVFLVTGNCSIARKNSTTISSEITNPLKFKMNCKSPFPVSGTKIITKNDTSATIDFGEGSCDRTATVTTDKGTIEITLKN